MGLKPILGTAVITVVLLYIIFKVPSIGQAVVGSTYETIPSGST